MKNGSSLSARFLHGFQNLQNDKDGQIVMGKLYSDKIDLNKIDLSKVDVTGE